MSFWFTERKAKCKSSHFHQLSRQFLKQKIIQKFQVPCFDPPNGTTIFINTPQSVPVDVSTKLLKRQIGEIQFDMLDELPPLKMIRESFQAQSPLTGIALLQGSQLRLVDSQEASQALGLPSHTLRFTTTLPVPAALASDTLSMLYSTLNDAIEGEAVVFSRDVRSIVVGSISVSLKDPSTLNISWSYEDEELASHVLSSIRVTLEN